MYAHLLFSYMLSSVRHQPVCPSELVTEANWLIFVVRSSPTNIQLNTNFYDNLVPQLLQNLAPFTGVPQFGQNLYVPAAVDVVWLYSKCCGNNKVEILLFN